MSSNEVTTKHTPEPWELIPNGGVAGPDEPNYWAISSGEGYFTGTVEAPTKYEHGKGFNLSGWMTEHDARLLWAAPALYEAAVWCKALCEEIGATETNAYAAVCSAIDKATVRG